MTTAQLSMIAPPPSVAAVLGALTEETRIGQVDFSTRLAPGSELDEVEETVETDDLEEADVSAGADDVDADELDEAQDEDRPATEVFTLVAVPDQPVDVVEPEPEPDPEHAAEHVAEHEPEPAEEPAAPAQRTTGPSAIAERIHGPAHLDATALLEPVEPMDERPPSIEEIARLVVERMHDAELAMMRHLDALEVEATRRAELATAQAELDAELIRLNARREAHAIVTAARGRTEQGTNVDPCHRTLDEVTESLTRFADVMDELRPSPRSGRTP